MSHTIFPIAIYGHPLWQSVSKRGGRVSQGYRYPRGQATAEIEHAVPVEYRSVFYRPEAPRKKSKAPLCLLPIIAESTLNTIQYPIKAQRKNDCSAITLPNILILKIDTQKEIFVFSMDQDVTKEYGFQYKAETSGGGILSPPR